MFTPAQALSIGALIFMSGIAVYYGYLDHLPIFLAAIVVIAALPGRAKSEVERLRTQLRAYENGGISTPFTRAITDQANARAAASAYEVVKLNRVVERQSRRIKKLRAEKARHVACNAALTTAIASAESDGWTWDGNAWVRPPNAAAGPSMAFDSAEALADWLETLHEADGPAVLLAKFKPAQVAARAIRAHLARSAASEGEDEAVAWMVTGGGPASALHRHYGSAQTDLRNRNSGGAIWPLYLRPAAQVAATPKPRCGDERHELDAYLWKRDSKQEWVLEISGEINGTSFISRHTEPLTTPPEDVAGLPSLYERLEVATQKHDERSEAFKMLVAVARAAHRAMDSGEEFADHRVMLEASGATELAHALDAMDALPDVPDPNYVYDGWARAAYFAAQPTPKHDEGREAEVAAEAWLTATARKAGPHGVSARDESLMRLGYQHGYIATQPAARRVTDEACEAVYDAVVRSGITRDVKSPERKREIVRAALESFAQPAEGVSGG